METIASENSYNIYHSFAVKASPEKVFDAVSLPEQLVQWWPLKCSGKPVYGETYNFYFGEKYDWLGKVVKCEPSKSFHIKMTKSDADWNPTSFGFDLEIMKEGVRLNFFHSNWPSCNQHFKHSSYCWALLLNGLKDYVEKGTVVPFEERN
ncbi:MAG: SRPBCC domain-containing protein [Cyclobacteriaceae bacterium]